MAHLSVSSHGDSSEEDLFVPKTSKRKEELSKNFKCTHCGIPFTRKDNLSVHIRKVHSDESSQRYECDFCDTSFAYSRDLKRHKAHCNLNSSGSIDKFECPSCKCKFSRKDNLSVHIKRCSAANKTTAEKLNYPCSFCFKSLSSKSSSTRHEKVCSKNSSSNAMQVQCPSCTKSFNHKSDLATHLKRGNCKEPKKKLVSCLYDSCDFTCFTKTTLIDHLSEEHDQAVKPAQTLTFNSEAEFQAWREKEEARTFSYYSQDCGRKGNRLYLYCQHDGSDRPHRKKNSEGRKTVRKVKIGQIKSGKICLSKMVVINEEGGSKKVLYHESHSHPLSKHDLAHQPVSCSTNSFINDQISLNVPVRDIFKTLQSSSSARESRDISAPPSRNLTITERRIRQRAARKRARLRLHQNDAVSTRMLVDSLLEENYNPVVIYKPMGEDVLVGPKDACDKILKDHFILGLQTREQRKLLVQYSSRVVIVDDTHNVTQYENVKLFNMLITDENNRGWPVGHLISNCMAAKVIKPFIRAIKIRCEEAGEVLAINCIISDDDSSLINGIEEGMSQNIRHILCQWHLDETFKDSIRTKAPRDMFDTIYTELKVIITERNEKTFSSLLNAFLLRHSEDAPNFIDYFKEYYCQRKEKWAMCYRQGLGHGNINTTGHAESLHNRLKTGEFKRKPNKRVDDLINTLLYLERRDFQERERLDILGFSEPPHRCQEKHDRGIAMLDSSISQIRDDMWLIDSATTKDQSYHISRIQDFCSKDLCFDKCSNVSCHGLCAHLFLCSCKDTFALCKHVHKLQSFLLKDCPVAAYENDTSDVKFYTVENDEHQSGPSTDQDEFSETNAYSRLEASLAALSHLIFQRSIPKNLLPSCDTQISDIVKKCRLLSLSVSGSMPPSRSIGPSAKLATQYSQMLPFKRRKKSKKSKLNAIDLKNKKEAARETLLGFIQDVEDEEDCVVISSGDDSSEEKDVKFHGASPSLKDIALFIGPYCVSFLALKTLSLDLDQGEVQRLKALDGTFEKGWLNSELINAFLYALALTNDSVFVGAHDLALSMARGNTLSRLFKHELPDKSIFLFPANFSGNHWTMFAVLQGKILYMDPIRGVKSPPVLKCIDTIKRIMNVVKPSVVSWTEEMVTYCHQTDTVNCGVHICWFAHQLIVGSDLEDLPDTVAYRNFIYEVVRGNCLQSLDKLNLCGVCSSEDSPCSPSDTTLQCGKCKQLFHQSCLNNDQLIFDKEFVCPEIFSR